MHFIYFIFLFFLNSACNDSEKQEPLVREKIKIDSDGK